MLPEAEAAEDVQWTMILITVSAWAVMVGGILYVGRSAYSAGWSGGRELKSTAAMAWSPVLNGRILYSSPPKWTLPVIILPSRTSITELMGSNLSASADQGTITAASWSSMTPYHTRLPKLLT